MDLPSIYYYYTPTTQSDIIESFEILDVNRNGIITFDGLYMKLQSLGFRVDIQDIEIIFPLFDHQGRGYFTFDDYYQTITKCKSG